MINCTSIDTSDAHFAPTCVESSNMPSRRRCVASNAIQRSAHAKRLATIDVDDQRTSTDTGEDDVGALFVGNGTEADVDDAGVDDEDEIEDEDVVVVVDVDDADAGDDGVATLVVVDAATVVAAVFSMPSNTSVPSTSSKAARDVSRTALLASTTSNVSRDADDEDGDDDGANESLGASATSSVTASIVTSNAPSSSVPTAGGSGVVVGIGLGNIVDLDNDDDDDDDDDDASDRSGSKPGSAELADADEVVAAANDAADDNDCELDVNVVVVVGVAIDASCDNGVAVPFRTATPSKAARPAT